MDNVWILAPIQDKAKEDQWGIFYLAVEPTESTPQLSVQRGSLAM